MMLYGVGRADKHPSGFTAAELITAMIVTGIVISIMYMAYFFGLKQFQQFRHQSVLERECILIIKTIGNDLINAKTILENGSGRLSVLRNDGKLMDYRLQNKSLIRNEFHMNMETVDITKFSVYIDKSRDDNFTFPGFSSQTSLFGRQKKETPFKPVYRIRLSCFYQERILDLETLVCPRNGHLEQMQINL